MAELQPVLSVVMPLYNVGSFLGETLASIAAQTMGEFEVLMVDDGSTDSTADVATAFAGRDGRFRYAWQANAGAAAARNNGMSLASGKYLVFLDGDDLFDPRMFERAVGSLEESGADVCLCKYSKFDSADGRPIPEDGPYPALSGRREAADYLGRLFQDITDQPWDKVYRTSFLRKCGVKFQTLPASNDLYFTKVTFALSSSAYFLDEVLVSYRVASGSSLQDKRIQNPTCALKAMKAVYEDLRSRPVFDTVADSFRFAYSSALMSCGMLVADVAPEFLDEALDLWNNVEKDFEAPISGGLGLSHFLLFRLRKFSLSRISPKGLAWVCSGEARKRTDSAPSAVSKIGVALRLAIAGMTRP